MRRRPATAFTVLTLAFGLVTGTSVVAHADETGSAGDSSSTAQPAGTGATPLSPLTAYAAAHAPQIGALVGAPASVSGGTLQHFEHGVLFDPAGVAKPIAVSGAIYTRWQSMGAMAGMGRPVADLVKQASSRSYQAFSRGTIAQSGRTITAKRGVWHIPTKYISQLKPLYAPCGCVPASLLMVLRSKGYATDVKLKSFFTGMPKAKTQSKGFVGDIYCNGHTLGTEAKASVKYAKRWTPTAANLTRATATSIAAEVKKGNPVVVFNKKHAVAIIGYKKGKFLIYDPMYGKKIKGYSVRGVWGVPHGNGWYKTSLVKKWLASNKGKALAIR